MLEKNVTSTGKIFVHIDLLKVWDKNPRQIDESGDERLRRQIAFLGQYKPLLVTEDGIIVGGNMRLREMVWLNTHVLTYLDPRGQEKTIDKRNGFNDVWITELSFGKNEETGKYRALIDGKVQEREYDSVEQIMIEYAISDNDSVGKYDTQALHALIAPHAELIPMANYSLELSPSVSLEKFMHYKSENKDGKEDDDVPGVAKEGEPVFSKPGEVYQLGRHKVICGDATIRESYTKLLQDQKVDMIFTDPPYNVAYEGKTKDALTIQNDKMGDGNFYQFLFDAFKNMSEFSKSGSSIYVCHADTERVNFTKSFMDAGWKLAQVVIWAKGHFVMGRQDYQWQHEPILYGWKEGEAHYYNGGHSQTTIWNMDRPTKATEHPTMKPIQLIGRALNNSSKGDDIILDPFLGSGSTLIACEQLGRTCYGIELDPKYVDVIRKRYAKIVGQKDHWQEATPAIGVVTDNGNGTVDVAPVDVVNEVVNQTAAETAQPDVPAEGTTEQPSQ